MKKFIVNLIRIIHFLLIGYVIFGPILFNNQTRNVIGLISFILYRWMTNDHSCMLTSFENKLAGQKNEGFIYRLVNPIYKINETKFIKNLYFVTFSWLMILIQVEFNK